MNYFSVRRGVSRAGRSSCEVMVIPIFLGSKDRLQRAKTIDLCQNPLTVRACLE